VAFSGRVRSPRGTALQTAPTRVALVCRRTATTWTTPRLEDTDTVPRDAASNTGLPRSAVRLPRHGAAAHGAAVHRPPTAGRAALSSAMVCMASATASASCAEVASEEGPSHTNSAPRHPHLRRVVWGCGPFRVARAQCGERHTRQGDGSAVQPHNSAATRAVRPQPCAARASHTHWRQYVP